MPDQEDSGYASGSQADNGGAPALIKKPSQDQPARNGARVQRSEGDRPGGSNLSGDARHEQYAAQQVDGGIAEPGALGPRPAAPHDQRRANGHHLPTDEQGDEIAGEGDADGAAGIDESSGQLGGAGLIEREQAPGEGHDGEDGGEQPRELVALHQDQVVAKEWSLQHGPVRNIPDEGKRHKRQRDDHDGAEAPAQKRQQQAADDQDETGRDEQTSCHSRYPVASGAPPAPWRRR